MEFDVAAVIKPISEILTSISRLLLEDLPGSVAPKAPDSAGQGNPPPLRGTLKGSEDEHGLCHCWGHTAEHRALEWDTHLLLSR